VYEVNDEEDFYEDEYDYEDEDEFNGIDLLDEPPDEINMIMLPNYKVDVNELVQTYITRAKRCKQKDEIEQVFLDFYNTVYAIASADFVYNDVQAKLHQLENLIEQMKLV
jgi:hypothetical protein